MLRPLVKAHGANRLRKGRGFSLGELRKVGLDPGSAKRLGIAVDRRRRSIWDENVEALRSFLDALSGSRSGSGEKPSGEGGDDSDEKER